ncbi:ABC transporter ATP-binding protein [Kineosporia babensis]|nr:dipeptide ABC transporter ATP-binding protein [Kineosporia babensis]
MASAETPAAPAPDTAAADPIMNVKGLVKHFPLRSGVVIKRQVGAVQAVDGVDLQVRPGETIGVVGESGCGKSTLAKLLIGLETPTAGSISLTGREMVGASGGKLKAMRRDVQMIFQDPYTSLNPRMTVGDIIAEPLEIHPDAVPKAQRTERVRELMSLVGLSPEHIDRYAHQFSGGQRQRIGIARGLALNPKLLICDEPVSALDVSVQAQVINLLQDLQNRLGISLIFIAHDLSVVRHISHRVAVMYLGRIVELGDKEQVYNNPQHPYTKALLSAVPNPDPAMRGKGNQIVLEGDPPSPANPPSGCRFRTRCWKAQAKCAEVDPGLELTSSGARAACHFPGDTPSQPEVAA